MLPQKDVLFHNHTKEGGYRYAYPLIQYKRLNNKAALFCIGEGVENIGVLFASNNFNVRIGNKRHCLQIEEVNAKQVDICMRRRTSVCLPTYRLAATERRKTTRPLHKPTTSNACKCCNAY